MAGVMDGSRTPRASCGGQPPPTTSIPEVCSASAPDRTAYPGAAVLGVEAAWRTGVGMVRYLGPERAADLVLARRPETVTADGRVQAWLIGSGTDAAARSDAETAALRGILSGPHPVVVDAGALDLAVGAPAPRIVTPHAREHARLRRRPRPRPTAADDDDERAAAARETAAALGATVRAEGRRDGRRRSPTAGRGCVEAGTPWLATAGTGDVLAGAIGAVVAAAGAARDGPRRRDLGRARRDRRRGCTAGPRRLAAARLRCRRGGPITALDVAEALPRAVAEALAAALRLRRTDGGRRCGTVGGAPRMSRVSRRAVLWIAFAVVHVAVAVARLHDAEPADGRRLLRLRAVVARSALGGHGIVGITESWVYPQLALVPMLLAQGLRVDRRATRSPGRSWSPRCDALAFALLIGRGRSTGRVDRRGWFWLAYMALLGPIAMYRIDAITVPLALAGCLWLVGRPWIGSVAPRASRRGSRCGRRRSSRPRSSRCGAGARSSAERAARSAAIVARRGRRAGRRRRTCSASSRTRPTAGSSSRRRSARSTCGGPCPASRARSSTTTATCSPSRSPGPQVDARHRRDDAAARRSPSSRSRALGAFKAWRGASFAALFPPLALALVLALIVFNKVGSPQYLTWIAAPLVVGARDRSASLVRAGALALVDRPAHRSGSIRWRTGVC